MCISPALLALSPLSIATTFITSSQTWNAFGRGVVVGEYASCTTGRRRQSVRIRRWPAPSVAWHQRPWETACRTGRRPSPAGRRPSPTGRRPRFSVHTGSVGSVTGVAGIFVVLDPLATADTRARRVSVLLVSRDGHVAVLRVRGHGERLGWEEPPRAEPREPLSCGRDQVDSARADVWVEAL